MIFTDLKLPVTSKIGIDGFTNNLSKKIYSHKGAWARIIKLQLQEKGYFSRILDKYESWNDYDIIIIDMGMEYKGTLNLFGGANDILAERLKSMIDFINKGGTIFTIEGKFPDINELIKSRLSSATEKFQKLILYAPEWHKLHEETIHIEKIYESENIMIGDSHILSMWRPGYEIYRYDGKTLHGMLKDGLVTYLPHGNIKKLILYFGNIDIRHHLLRFDNPLQAAHNLIDEYFNQINDLTNPDFGFDIQVICPMAIETEERKIPKTGYYKGTPYYGSWYQRTKIRDHFCIKLLTKSVDSNIRCINWPDWYRNYKQELRIKTMEKPKSVHLSPEYYYWDLENNCINNKYKYNQNQEKLF